MSVTDRPPASGAVVDLRVPRVDGRDLGDRAGHRRDDHRSARGEDVGRGIVVVRPAVRRDVRGLDREDVVAPCERDQAHRRDHPRPQHSPRVAAPRVDVQWWPVARGVEADRLEEARAGVPWKRWGPYLSERQWGTVREDYSDNGDAWSYFSHDQARSRAYKWGEDGIAGFCDDHQRLCFGDRAVERRRPDPEGADVRSDERRGQPRRGRQGVLLLPRRHADELVPEVPLPLSARRVPVRRSRRDEPRPRPAGAGVRAARHRGLRRRSLRRRRRRVREGDARRHPRPHHPHQPRRRAGDSAPAAVAVVPQHVVDG